MALHWPDGYSAQIDAYLLVNGERYAVAQVVGGALILRQPQQIAAGTPARLVIAIDGHEKVQSIVLGEGASVGQQLVPYF